MAGRNFLFVPGPTNVPDRVQRAMVVAMEDHRSSKFPELTLGVLASLKKVFKTTTGIPIIFPSSGTGCWEAALTNCLSPGDKVLASRFGQFSHLWIDMTQRLGFEVEIVDCEWGTGVPVERYQALLEADKSHKIKAVLACHNETATGVSSDIAAVRRVMNAANHPALLFVDAVSSLASIDFRMDEWGVDVCVSGSQKGLMLPAGLGVTCVSPKAMAAYPFCRLSGPANVLIMPAWHSASISTKLLQELGGSTVIGPLLVGFDKPVQIVSLAAKDSDIVNMAALAAFNLGG